MARPAATKREAVASQSHWPRGGGRGSMRTTWGVAAVQLRVTGMGTSGGAGLSACPDLEDYMAGGSACPTLSPPVPPGSFHYGVLQARKFLYVLFYPVEVSDPFVERLGAGGVRFRQSRVKGKLRQSALAIRVSFLF